MGESILTLQLQQQAVRRGLLGYLINNADAIIRHESQAGGEWKVIRYGGTWKLITTMERTGGPVTVLEAQVRVGEDGQNQAVVTKYYPDGLFEWEEAFIRYCYAVQAWEAVGQYRAQLLLEAPVEEPHLEDAVRNAVDATERADRAREEAREALAPGNELLPWEKE